MLKPEDFDLLDDYTRGVCSVLRADYTTVRSWNARGRHLDAWVRFIVVRHFTGVMQMKDVAEYLRTTPSQVSTMKRRFFEAYNRNYKFRRVIETLIHKGYKGLIDPAPMPNDILKELDRQIDICKYFQKELVRNIDSLYQLKIEINKYIKR